MLRRILSIYSEHKKEVAIQLAIIFSVQGLGMISPYVFGKITDALIHKENLGYIILLISVAPVIAIVDYFLLRLRQHVGANLVWFPIQERLRFKTLGNYLGFSIGQHKNQHSGISQEIASKGEDALQTFANTLVTFYLPMLVRVLITISILFWLHLPLGIVVLVGLVLYGIGQWKMEGKYFPLITERRDSGLESSRYRGDLMRGAVLVKSHGKEKWVQEKYRNKYHATVALSKVISRYTATWDGALKLLVDLTEYVALGIGVFLIYRNKLSLGELVTARIWWQQACAMVGQIGDRYQDTLEQISGIKKFFDLLDTPPAIKESENAIRLGKLTGEIEFRNISFGYPVFQEDMPKKTVLDNISMTIKMGEKIAIVGPSGCGKTTLITLLQRGYDPDTGTIEIGGYHLSQLALEKYYEQVAIVDQSSLMIDGTVRDNLLLGVHDTLSDERLLELCAVAELDMSEFPKGLDHNVGQDGKKLSGGQRQRIAIARAIASDPAILVLDEATASLDGIAEAKIQSAITKASAGRTIIMIAHRISTVQNADRIYVMEKGKIIDAGTHIELMHGCALYKELVMSQLIDVPSLRC